MTETQNLTTSAPSTARQWGLAMVVALVAGYVDGYGLLVLSTFLSFMSGNTTATGTTLGQGNFSAAAPTAIAIIFFTAGCFAGVWLLHSHCRRKLLCAAVAVVLGLVTALAQFGPLNANLEIAVVSLAMGMMNATVSHVGAEPISLTFVTGTLNKIAGHLALAAKGLTPADAGPGDTHLRRATVLAGIWAAFLTGATLAAVAIGPLGPLVLLPPAVILAILTLLVPN